MIIRVPADLAARAASLIGAPYLAKGEAPDGWDCLGLVRWSYARLLGYPLPDYSDRYDAALTDNLARHERARRIAAGLAGGWTPIAPQAGAAVVLSRMGAAGHVGFLISPELALHVTQTTATSLLDLTARHTGWRAVGAYAPRGAMLSPAS